MSLIITPKEEISKYFESDAVSQSYLKQFIKGYDKVMDVKEDPDKLYFEEKANMLVGSGVDTMLTAGMEVFNETYHISKIEKKPSDTEMSIVNQVFDMAKEDNEGGEFSDLIGNHRDRLDQAITEHDWYKGKPGDKRIGTLLDNTEEYFKDLHQSLGKTILSKEQYDIIQTVVFSLRTNPRTAKYFDDESHMRNQSVMVIYQLPIYFMHHDVKCKSLLDLVIVVLDEDGNPIVVEPFDLKTTMFKTLEFHRAIISFRYDIQAAWYTLALKYWVQQAFSKDVEIRPFRWIVESTTNPGVPLLYQATDELMKIGQYGRDEVKVDDVVVRYRIKGYEELFDEHLWYENHSWEQPRQLQTMNSEFLKVGWEGIVEDED